MTTAELSGSVGALLLAADAPVATATSRLRRVLRRCGDVATLVLGGVAMGLLLFAVGLYLTGHRVTTVLSGSMEPQLPVGALVVTERVPISSIHASDVVVFPRPDHASETVVHRVISITPTGDGALQAHTKGDHNAVEDPWVFRVSASTKVDRAAAVVPHVGQAISLARQWALQALAVLLAAGLAVAGLRRVWGT